VTAKEARQQLHEIVRYFAHIELHEVHQHAFKQITMETSRCIAKENAERVDSFILLVKELFDHRDSVHSLFATSDPAIVFTFAYRYLIVLRYLSTAPLETRLNLSSDNQRFIEQTLIDLYAKIEEPIYNELISLHAAIQKKLH
jgi:hypothetical protein